MRNTSELSVVFVGCGGTFFMGMPYFKVLVRRCKPRRVVFVDPDKVLGKNLDRQWPYREARGQYKAMVAREEFCSRSNDPVFRRDSCHVEIPFLYAPSSFGTLVQLEVVNGGPVNDGDVLLVVNVDNDEARLEVREWANGRKGWTGMVVSGCEADYGQAYWGAWQDGVVIHDWWVLHPDVGQVGGTEHRCAPQTAEANAMTGVLVGLALADLLTCYDWDRSASHVREYYWSMDALMRVRSWTMEVKRQGESDG